MPEDDEGVKEPVTVELRSRQDPYMQSICIICIRYRSRYRHRYRSYIYICICIQSTSASVSVTVPVTVTVTVPTSTSTSIPTSIPTSIHCLFIFQRSGLSYPKAMGSRAARANVREFASKRTSNFRPCLHTSFTGPSYLLIKSKQVRLERNF